MSDKIQITDEAIIEEINEIEYLKSQIAELSEAKANLEKVVADKLKVESSVNNKSTTFVCSATNNNDEYEFKVTMSSSIKIDNLDGLKELANDLIDTKYECNKSRFAKLLQEDPAKANKVSDFIIITPAKPSFSFKKGK